jgi:hypothetical protein
MFVAGGRFLGFRMPDELRSPIKHHLVLHRIDPERGIRRFYTLMIGRDLFRTVRPVSNWGRTGPADTTRCASLPPQSGCWISIGRCSCAHMTAWITVGHPDLLQNAFDVDLDGLPRDQADRRSLC